MTFGITVFNAHLNVRSSPPDPVFEIDWQAFKTWNNNKMPQFAGRYFLGQPYLWGHGEATEIFNGEKIPYIVPIQKADKDRQEATGLSGYDYGIEDADALCTKLITCMDMRELSLVGKYVPVFLEVEKGTKLSGEYWSAWCNSVVSTLYSTIEEVNIQGITVPMPNVFFPFFPCICCEFIKTAAGKYAVNAQVRACLEMTGKSSPGKWEKSRCRGFWARVTDIPEYHAPEPALDWSKFESFEQPQSETAKVPVPILFWRYMDSLDPAVPGIDQFDKFTLDAMAPAAEKSLLKVENWKLATVDSAGGDSVLTPTLFGLDRGASLKNQIPALAKENMKLPELPSTYRYNDQGIEIHVNNGVKTGGLKGKPTFVGRYYTGRPTDHRDLTPLEASKISRTGIDLVVFFQGKAQYYQVPDYLLSNLNANQGQLDAMAAFSYAAEIIKQPAYTPIYFAVDSLVISPGGFTQSLSDNQGNAHIVPVPTVIDIVMYFTDVNAGYQEYLRQRKAADLVPIPYYVGVYASRNVLDALYVQGLATFFWQAWPIIWGDRPFADSYPNLKVWPHNNVWQVMLANMRQSYWGLVENTRIEVAAGGLDANGIGPVDLNVAWGDTGGWKTR